MAQISDKYKRPRGRPKGTTGVYKTPESKAVPVNLCVRDAEQRDKLKALGDSKWLQVVIDREWAKL